MKVSMMILFCMVELLDLLNMRLMPGTLTLRLIAGLLILLARATLMPGWIMHECLSLTAETREKVLLSQGPMCIMGNGNVEAFINIAIIIFNIEKI
jgi:hypothetical protein